MEIRRIPGNTQQRGLDYTPRELGSKKDVRSLAQALLKDALRQTPSVVYVGELREEHHLETALNFARTGHLIVSTTHAGSLVEAMGRAFAAMKVKTAEDRGRSRHSSGA
jgi:Tfp pilus assembly pilus retraction ATPase PilT